jgi:hypothetical protein
MPKLHEILAVEGPLKAQADKTRTELISTTFDKKRHLFFEKITTFQPTAEGAVPVVEEQSSLQSTVRKELGWIQGIWSKALDGAHAIAEANTQARADVVLEDGTVILKNVPVTSLLELEKRAQEMQELVAAIPPLDSAKNFVLDPDRGKDIYKAREDVRQRTKKTQAPLVLYEATKEHPAQVKEISIDVPQGEIRTQEWSGLITTADKSDMLDRAEQLARAFKAARSRANNVDIPTAAASIGNTLLSFVFNGASPASEVKPKSGQA